jgi:hypothetical protein
VPTDVILIIAGVAVVVFAIFVLARVVEQRRVEGLQALAANRGFDFEREAETLPQSAFAHLRLFQRGHGRRAHNVIKAGRGDDACWCFDYRWVIGSGKHRRVNHRSVVAWRLPDARLPAFELFHEHFFHRIGAALGMQDIDFAEFPEFSKRYVLRGDDEQAVRSLFTSQRITVFEGLASIGAEGAGEWLVVYHTRRRVAPRNIPEFMEQAAAVRRAFV